MDERRQPGLALVARQRTNHKLRTTVEKQVALQLRENAVKEIEGAELTKEGGARGRVISRRAQTAKREGFSRRWVGEPEVALKHFVHTNVQADLPAAT